MNRFSQRKADPHQKPQPGQQIQVNVDLSTADQIFCPHCGAKVFQPGITLYRISAIVSPTGQEMMAQQPILMCINCDHVMGSEDVKEKDNTDTLTADTVSDALKNLPLRKEAEKSSIITS